LGIPVGGKNYEGREGRMKAKPTCSKLRNSPRGWNTGQVISRKEKEKKEK